MIEVSLKRVIYKDPESNFVIASMKVENGEIPEFVELNNNCLTCKGFFPASETLNLEVLGQWEKTKYGYQLNVDTFSEKIPQTKEGIIAYLSSGLICGIGEKTAEKIVSQFGLDTMKVFDNTPELLMDVSGISRKKLNKIIDSYNNHRAVAQIINYLAPLGVSTSKCLKIYKTYADNSMSVLTKEPFKLCEIDGFGFATVDQIARKTSYFLNDVLRIKAAIKYVLEQAAATEGHLCLNQSVLIIKAYLLLNSCESLYNRCCKYLQTNSSKELKNFLSANGIKEVVTFDEVLTEIKSLAVTKVLKGDNGYAYLESYYCQEQFLAKDIVSRVALSKKLKISEDTIRNVISSLEDKYGIQLATKQKEAVISGVQNNICIITGGPGTGKTTVLKFILETCRQLLKADPNEITLLAPTGKAASRMAESVGSEYTSSTIHSKLHLVNEEGICYASDAIDSKIVVVDEASMIDSFLMYSLVMAIPYSSKFIIIGDVDQLPSVGAGNVLLELLKSKLVPTVRLDTIYRQSGTSLIVVNSDLIKQNISKLRYGENFKLIPVTAYDKQTETSQIVIAQFLEELKSTSLDEVQVLCPFKKKGVKAGASELNTALQDVVNPPSQRRKEINKGGGKVFREGDKVMQVKNNYDLAWKCLKTGHSGCGVYNGECGFISSIDDNEITIRYDEKIVVYDVTQLDEITLAYAISIHKSQGSEYRTVIIPLLTSFSIMLKRNLIYTAISRAKEKVIIVGEQRAIDIAVHNNSISRRNTQLADKIINLAEKSIKSPTDDVKDKQINLLNKKEK